MNDCSVAAIALIKNPQCPTATGIKSKLLSVAFKACGAQLKQFPLEFPPCLFPVFGKVLFKASIGATFLWLPQAGVMVLPSDSAAAGHRPCAGHWGDGAGRDGDDSVELALQTATSEHPDGLTMVIKTRQYFNQCSYVFLFRRHHHTVGCWHYSV